jgi:hypothetical protein
MAINNLNPGNSGDGKSRAEQRLEAFLGPRITRDTSQGAEGRLVRRGLDEEPEESLSPAEYRLQQLHLFRQMKELAALEPAESFGRGSRDIAVAGQLNWVPLGPLGVEKGQAATNPIVSGRVKSIAVAPGGQRVYIATANGGCWYSGDSGKNWRSLFDPLNFYLPAPGAIPDPLNPPPGVTGDTDSLACGAIALVPGTGNANDKIYIGTGEGDGMTDAYLGVGPLVSSDGGSSWVREIGNPSLVGRGFYAMVVDPDDPDRVIAGTSTGIYARVPNGVGGFRWDRKGLGGKRVTGLTVAKNAAGKRFYASVWNDKVYTSTDGDNWADAGANFPSTRIGRITVASHPTTPDLAYALVAFEDPEPVGAAITQANPKNGHLNGVYRLDTRLDNQWRQVSSGMPQNLFGADRVKDRGQGNYDNWIVVSPDNENRFFLAGSTVNSGGAWSGSIFRCDVTVTTAAGTTTINGANTYIGASSHADVHNLTFTPNDPEQLWVGCDGGIYMTRQASGNGNIFQSLNAGLQTVTMNHLGLHPDEEDTFFASVQDNGCLRYFGENIWFHSFGGDSGFCIINWLRRNEVLATYVTNTIQFSNTYGNRPAPPAYADVNRNVPLQSDATPQVVEQVKFYAPLVGIPFKTGLPNAQADMVAFGTDRPWISTDFGANWFPLPSRTPNNLASWTADSGLLGNARISAMAFADSKNLLVGLEDGKIFKFTDTSGGNNWTTVTSPPAQLDTAPFAAGSSGKPNTSVSDLVMDPASANKFYAVFGGIIGSNKHIWYFDGTNWNDRSGSGANMLLDVHFSTLVINPDNPNQIFAGCDLGAWKSEDAGVNWQPFSNGLPETAVIDLVVTSRAPAAGGKVTLLRVATYGRGVFECDISPGVANTPPAILYVRDNILDHGRFATRTGVSDPRNLPGGTITDLDSPDIKVDVPDANGKYQFSPFGKLSAGEFSQVLIDKSSTVPVPASGQAVSRVYVQVHSRGMAPAFNAQVTLMIKDLNAGNFPDLPTNYDTNIKSGAPINIEGWQTVGAQMVQGVIAGQPKVVGFNLPSSLLPANATLGAGKDLALVAILHYPGVDEYTSNGKVLNPATANNVGAGERKVSAHKIKAVQSAAIPALTVRQPLAGYVNIPASATAPEAPYDAFLAQAFRLNDGLFNKLALSRFAQPISNRGTDGVTNNPDAKALLFADTITMTASVSSQAGVPLIWFARNKITISQPITAKGFGALRTGDGDFGGGGGGGASSAGKKCSLPRSNPAIDIGAGGAIGNNAGANLDATWATRALLQPTFCSGGGAGGDDGANLGGLGGGVVILCAPTIEFAGGQIDASGAAGAGNAGGGGGGLIILIASEVKNMVVTGAGQNIFIGGGTSGGTGGTGGAGLIMQKKFQ